MAALIGNRVDPEEYCLVWGRNRNYLRYFDHELNLFRSEHLYYVVEHHFTAGAAGDLASPADNSSKNGNSFLKSR
jgi:hypothetical protein